ncbi:DUF2474 domain-containing protein [Pseudomonas duriflava]|uniref:DUF2474 domain-containing protein n=1 Tax=Pseudomonas duriflava TaxID=459528 RepID=UPI0011A7022E|nr:DUF2474 domain-containing protein [Pseudomonas duriflava]
MAGQEQEPNPAEGKPLWKRLGWMLVIWAGSVAALGILSYGLRLFMSAAGLKS